MTEYNYNQIIEYIDNTYDENFNAAKKWAINHGTTFDERMDLRDLPKRYFQIGEEYIPPVPPPPPEPTEDEKKESVRTLRNTYLLITDHSQLADVPYTEEERQSYREYRQYLRNYTDQPNWWEQDPLTYDEWKK